MARGWRRNMAAMMVAGLMASSHVAATAATRLQPVGVVTLELAGHTTIHWKGTAAIRLHSPVDAVLPDPAGIRIRAKGTYAFIRAYDHQKCGLAAYCYMDRLSWTPSISDGMWGPAFNRQRPSGTDHDRDSSFTKLGKGYTTLYLAADGPTTLELITPSVPGRRTMTPTKTWPVKIQRLPIDCSGPGGTACDPKQGYGAGRARFGGAVHDVGRLGYAESLVINAEASDQIDSGVPGVPLQEPVGLLPCVYARGTNVSQDPEPSHHATGCDVANGNGPPDPAVLLFLAETSAYPLQSGRQAAAVFTQVVGRGYAGYIIDNIVNYPEPKWREAWGIWFSYAR